MFTKRHTFRTIPTQPCRLMSCIKFDCIWRQAPRRMWEMIGGGCSLMYRQCWGFASQRAVAGIYIYNYIYIYICSWRYTWKNNKPVSSINFKVHSSQVSPVDFDIHVARPWSIMATALAASKARRPSCSRTRTRIRSKPWLKARCAVLKQLCQLCQALYDRNLP